LADSLIDHNLGNRPITLVGFSIGARVIYSCLKELAKKGKFGIIQNVYMFGSPMVVNKDEYLKARTVVSGRFLNGYARNDWILGYLFRATAGGIMRIAGLAPVEVEGIENINVTEFVPGHMSYRSAMPKLLREVGWEVENLEFAEIEDPDPENHDKRQRELINEIEDARKKLEKKPSRRGLKALFSKNKKLAEKKEWETYDERIKVSPEGQATNGETTGDSDIMFDVDAIRREAAELAVEGGFQIREIESTLPPMKMTMGPPSPALPTSNGPSRPGSLQLSRNKHSSNNSLSHRFKEGNRSNGHLTQNGYRPSYDNTYYDEGPVSLNFEADQRPSLSTSRSPSRPTFSPTGSATHSRTPSAQRSQLHTTHSLPSHRRTSSRGNLNSEYNAWANEDQELESTREEVEMTFE